MSTAFLVGLVISSALIVLAAYFRGYRAGLEDQTPADALPCGHKRNPHPWGKWAPYANIFKGDCVVGMMQRRTCERCGLQELCHTPRRSR